MSSFSHNSAEDSSIIREESTILRQNIAFASGISLAPFVIRQREIEWATAGGLAGQGWRVNTVAKDDRDILDILKSELDFIEKGGYGRSVRTPWQPKSTFQDSLTCINYADPKRAHPCNECHLMEFVSPEHRGEEVPCHFINLNEGGETVEALEPEDNEADLERKVKDWLRARIREIEEKRSQPAVT